MRSRQIFFPHRKKISARVRVFLFFDSYPANIFLSCPASRHMQISIPLVPVPFTGLSSPTPLESPSADGRTSQGELGGEKRDFFLLLPCGWILLRRGGGEIGPQNPPSLPSPFLGVLIPPGFSHSPSPIERAHLRF